MSGSGQQVLPIMAGIGVGVATGNPGLGFAAASAMGTAQQGIAAHQTGQAQKKAAKLKAEHEKLRGAQEARSLKDRLKLALGAITARSGSRGTLGSGTSDTFLRSNRRRGERNIRISELTTDANAGSIVSMGKNAARAGTDKMFASFLTAGAQSYLGYQGYQQQTRVDEFLDRQSRTLRGLENDTYARNNPVLRPR